MMMSTQSVPSSHNSADPLTQMNIYKHYVTVLADPSSKEDLKVKAAMELTDNFEIILTSSHFPAFLEHSVKLFLQVLQEGPPLFISEYNLQQVRKQILEMMYLLPWNDHLKPYVRQILSLMFKMIEIENEENVLVCLRIIIELHKQFRPAFNSEIHHFIQLVKAIYRDLPTHKDKIFDPKPVIKVKEIQEIDINAMLAETYTVTVIPTDNKTADGSAISYNLIPKGMLSLKVLQELPIVVVLMYQLYKSEVQDELTEFIPSIINTITLRPTAEQMANVYFNKEIFVDFMGAQIKTLSFLAYIIRVYQNEVAQHSQPMVRGIISMLQLCPMEVVHLRKELFIAARHITATDLRTKFVPYMDHLFDEDVLLGRGWTTRESLRPLAYSTLADLVHHVRSSLAYNNLEKAIHLFSKNVHDESLPTSIQTMSCKLLLNLVDCVRTRSDQENGRGRALLMRLLQVFVLKFKTISKLQLPILVAKTKAQAAASATATSQVDIKSEEPKLPISEPLVLGEKSKFGFPASQAQNYTITDTRSLVKTLICGVKTITWGITSCKSAEDGTSNKQFQPKETLVFISLVKWAMQALDIYTLSVGPAVPPHASPRVPSPQSVRTKEEKEMLEYFAGVFSSMAPQTFHEIFSTTIDYLVERIYRNYALQIVGNSFLANPSTSSIFATILVEYLLERMEEMGSNLEKSNLYLKLFKLVFGSVSLFPTENEQMLRPHLHQIVNRSMELAMSAKEPYNYFLLLRALFRSIGGGCHDLLYQEFLPLLPTLLQGLNCLQSGLHKQHMKDLFVELCLTVPVRLSSLLPYLPMLMDPLVSALNGSHTLISQGLRTLELCVDNLQPDFLYEHIQPVRADLMQALWRTLRNPQDQVAHVAFRVLGKFGGGNRKMMIEPQRLEYNDNASQGSSLVIYFEEYPDSVDLPVQKIIETALTTLKTSTSDPFYRKQAWEVIRDFLIASIQLDDNKSTLLTLLSHPSFLEGPIASHHHYKLQDTRLRETHQAALTALFVTAAIKELRQFVLPTMVAVVRHYTMVAVCQQAGPFAQTTGSSMDPLVIVDALVTIMGHEEKELCKPGHLAIILILETANRLLGSKERACQLPLMEYLSDKMVSLCYERAWYAKYGGCIVINMLFERMTSRWVFDHLYAFLKALLFVMMDLTGEVSTGAIDMAKVNLEKMLTTCAAPIPADGKHDELVNAQKKSMHDVIHELVRLVASSNTLVREQAMSSLTLIAKIQGLTVTQVMEPHREVLAEMVPPKKHLLRHQTVNAQIGIMEGNTFCTTLNPRLFTIDLSVMEHKVFFHEVMSLVESDDSALLKYACYKSITNLVPLRQCALRALSACHYIQGMREKIFNVLYKAMEKPELQKVVLDCMRNFIAGAQIEIDIVRSVMRPLLMTLGDYRTLDLNGTKRLYYLTELFPSTFNEKFCEQLLQHLRKLLEVQATGQKTVSKNGENEQKIATIISIFHKIPAASAKFCDFLTRVVLQTEKSLCIEASSPFREPLLQFLLRYPNETIRDMFLNESIKDPQWSRFLLYLIKHKEGKPFRDVIQNNVPKLITLITAASQKTALPVTERYEIQYQGIRLVSLLVRYDEQWLSSQKELAQALKELWCSEAFHEHHRSVDTVDFVHWTEPKLLLKVLLHFFCHHPTEVDLLFHLLRAMCERYIPDFQFLREFLETTVAQNYTVEWKRAAFFRFVEDFQNPNMSEELKAKILQLVLIPCFAIGFERGEGEKLVGSPVSPDQDNPDNIVSVFINRVIDPDNPFGNTDAVRIALLQFSCLLVEQASPHIHNVVNKRQGHKLRRLMTFAWPCLLGKNCVDPSTRYHGHLLLSHIIAKFAIHKRIVLQVFHSLLKAHGLEARPVVRQALEILTPAMPHRMEDGNTMLTHWTKKIIVEEGHNMAQLFHILFLVIKHFRVYYPVRHHLLQHMIQSIQKMGFTGSATMEQRKLAVELAEVVIKWELHRIRDEAEAQEALSGGVGATKRLSSDDPQDHLRKRLAAGAGPVPAPTHFTTTFIPKTEPSSTKPIEKHHADAVLNYLLRLACQVNDATPTANSQGDLLSRRCVALLKTAMKPDLWPQPWDLKLAWLDKIFCSLESASPNFGNICTGLELLTFLLGVLKREQILASVKPMQKGLTVCITSSNSKVVRLTHAFLTKLMSMFPTETHLSGAASKYDELEVLYSSIGKFILEGLTNYEKNQSANPNSLFGTIMILKAACLSNPSYIDRVISPFMRVLQRMHKEHSQGTDALGTELLMTALELVKSRLGAMQSDIRKAFIGTILVKLIETTREAKLLKSITKMLDEWVRQPPNQPMRDASHFPVLKEKCLLLVKLMTYVERNFPDDLELNAQFLEIVNFIYRDPYLKTSELAQKLEPAFLQGLRCVQPQIRAKFFEIFDGSMKRRIHDRLYYLISSQNWEAIGAHYWIKQCIELLFITADPSKRIRLSSTEALLPSMSSIIESADINVRACYDAYASIKLEPTEAGDSPETHENVELDLEFGSAGAVDPKKEDQPKSSKQEELVQLIWRQAKFLDTVRDVKTGSFLRAAAQLCHMDAALAERVWLDLFPRVWTILTDRQRNTLSMDMVPFLCSGAHEIQKNCQPSALNTFIEALSRCDPPIPMRPVVIKYLGKSHNLWHRMTLNLEALAFEQINAEVARARNVDHYDFDPISSTSHEIMDSLSEMYAKLCEQDMWAGLWQKHARYRETNIAIAYEQQGFFEQAQAAYEAVMGKSRHEFSSTPAPVYLRSEYKLWEEHWVRCSKELSQWDILLEYGHSRGSACPMLVLENSWKIPNWSLMKEALGQVEQTAPKEIMWKIELYRGFLNICNSEDSTHVNVEKCVEQASASCMKEWRRLPHIVSHIHLPLLQAAQQIMELQEAAQIHQGLTPNRPTGSSLHDMKAIVKTWRNRLPVIADDLSHWSDIFTWRQHHYQFIASHYDSQHEPNPNHSMLGVHASAQAIIHFGKIARKHNLCSVCLGSLSRIYTIPSVPIVDCFQKIRQQVKCSLQMSSVSGKNELQEGLEVIESTNLKYFTKEMTAEFCALKGMLLAQIGRSEEANKAFSAAVQMHDTLVKAWALWGDYLEHVFTNDPSNINIGVQAITCFLHACRHQNESKSRKYLAKVLWLLTYDNDQYALAQALDKYCVGVPPIQWLPWVPQLLTCLVRDEGKLVLNLISQVARIFPQAVYFPLRTLYLTLKIEQRERYKTAEIANASAGAGHEGEQKETKAGDPIRATPSMWRCSRIMQMQREVHPTVLSSLEGIVDQMVYFRETWYEEVLRQSKQGLAKCYAIAFENRGCVAEATITPHTLNFVNKLVATFGIGVENINSSVNSALALSSSASVSLVRRTQSTIQDPVFQMMKQQFSSDLDFTVPGAQKLQNLIEKLKKWIAVLQTKAKPKSFLIEEKCRFLSNFSQHTAEVELPGEFLLPKHAHYYVKISRFMPRVDIVHKHNTAARRLHIRGHNGKIYPYLVLNDSYSGDARCEERVLQLLRMLNHYLGKQKETSSRFLHMTVPRVVAVSPQMRLVEDNPASVSLQDIYREGCLKRGMDHDAPIARYYERLQEVQASGIQPSHHVLKDIFKEVQRKMVPKSMLKEWALRTFPSTTDFWTFRKMLMLQLSLACFVEYIFHLTRLNPDMMYLHKDSGLINVSYFKFEVDDQAAEMDRPVRFRLTPNLTEMISAVGVRGPLTASGIAAARCLVQPGFKVKTILRAILRDEIIFQKKLPCDRPENAAPTPDLEGKLIIDSVTNAVNAILQRLTNLAQFEGTDSKMATLVSASTNEDNLCRMDPAWHPWL